MKYSSSQVRAMSEKEWVEAMASELNAAGFKARGLNPNTHRWEDNYEPYRVGSEPKASTFVMGGIDDSRAIEHLKNVGLLNNGRCPMCGGPIDCTPARFTSGYDSTYHFQICQSCCGRGKRTSANPANNQGCGCAVALLLMPYNLIKSLIDMVFA